MSSFLRTRLGALHKHFGAAGLVVAVVALIAALAGGAIAASGGSGDQATASAKGKPGPRGKTGKTGPTGPAGPAGPQGPAGAAGAKGDAGAAGQAGAAGAKGATGATGTAGTTGAAGGIGATGATGPAGAPGATGPTGPSGSSGGTLAPGVLMTGGWAFNGTEDDTKGVYVPISFPTRLSGALEEENVHYVTAAEVGSETAPAACPGNVAFPKALEGNLCVYESNEFGIVNSTFDGIFNFSDFPGTSRSGAYLRFKITTGVGTGDGSWAVTGF